VLVHLTPEGRTTVDRAFEKLLEAEQGFLASLPDRDRTRLAGLLRTLLAPFAG
jgi:DNA-binding MarR family transcriptional regulator